MPIQQPHQTRELNRAYYTQQAFEPPPQYTRELSRESRQASDMLKACMEGLQKCQTELGSNASPAEPHITHAFATTEPEKYKALIEHTQKNLHQLTSHIITKAKETSPRLAKKYEDGLAVLNRRLLPFTEEGLLKNKVSTVFIDDFVKNGNPLIEELVNNQKLLHALPDTPARAQQITALDDIVKEMLLKFSRNVCNPGLLNEIQYSLIESSALMSGQPLKQQLQTLFSSTLGQLTLQMLQNTHDNPLWKLTANPKVRNWFTNTTPGNETHVQTQLLNTLSKDVPLPVTKVRDIHATPIPAEFQSVSKVYRKYVETELKKGKLNPVLLASELATEIMQEIRHSIPENTAPEDIYSKTTEILEGLKFKYGEIPISKVLTIDEDGSCQLSEKQDSLNRFILSEWHKQGLIEPDFTVAYDNAGEKTNILSLKSPNGKDDVHIVVSHKGEESHVDDELSVRPELKSLLKAVPIFAKAHIYGRFFFPNVHNEEKLSSAIKETRSVVESLITALNKRTTPEGRTDSALTSGLVHMLLKDCHHFLQTQEGYAPRRKLWMALLADHNSDILKSLIDNKVISINEKRAETKHNNKKIGLPTPEKSLLAYALKYGGPKSIELLLGLGATVENGFGGRGENQANLLIRLLEKYKIRAPSEDKSIKEMFFHWLEKHHEQQSSQFESLKDLHIR